MKGNIIRQKFFARGTTCESCERIICRQAMKVEGVSDVDFDYSIETGTVEYDPGKTDMSRILSKIEEKGYSCSLPERSPAAKRAGKSPLSATMVTLSWIVIGIGALVLGYFLLGYVEGIELPQISQNMGYSLLFLVGVLTGFHCIAMCGGFVVSYTAKDAQRGRPSHLSHLYYGLGKTVSYTVIGAVFGLIGSIIAFTPMMRGVAGILAGVFLLLFGLKMLNIIPALRKIQFRVPGFIDRFVGKGSKGASPLVIGLLNGLMIACGPLQAIYIMAAGTGSVIEGATLLFVFALGTLPVMLGFGYFASFISGKMTQKILKASGVIVMVLGVIMINRGLALTGSGYDIDSMIASVSASDIGAVTGAAIGVPSGAADGSVAVMKDGYQEIRMDVLRSGWDPDRFVLQKGVPVRWVIDGKEITGCNNAIQVPKLGIEFDVRQGEQVIEFTPEDEGVVPWSCWMGMIQGTFIVVDDVADAADVSSAKKAASVSPSSSGGCGGACGSPTCGAASGSGCGCGR